MNWQERLNAHEENAPQDGWDNLRESLELDHSGFRQKMLALESEAPADAWPRIQRSLRTEMSLTFVSRIIPLFRKHAVTAGIAASLMLVLFIYQGTSENNTPATLGLATEIGSKLSTPGATTPVINPSVLETDDRVIATASDTTYSKNAATASRTHPRPMILPKSFPNELNMVPLQADKNYIEICNQQGQCSRLTYKLEEWASCIDAACPESQGTRAERNRKIEAWRARLEQSSYIHAAGHFFDIGEMAELLQNAALK